MPCKPSHFVKKSPYCNLFLCGAEWSSVRYPDTFRGPSGRDGQPMLSMLSPSGVF